MTDEITTQVNCTFSSEASLYAAYMPFIKGGGLFIRTDNTYQLGECISLSVTLFAEPEPYLIDTQVVWITPKGTQGNKPPGIGLQFIGDASLPLFRKIETYLAEMIKSSQLTDTI